MRSLKLAARNSSSLALIRLPLADLIPWRNERESVISTPVKRWFGLGNRREAGKRLGCANPSGHRAVGPNSVRAYR